MTRSRDFEPGPWYELSRWQKALRWLRYQPAYKVRAFWTFLRYLGGWGRTYRHYPPFVPADDHRAGPDGMIYPPPRIAWEITVAQDAPGLERYWLWVRNDDDAE